MNNHSDRNSQRGAVFAMMYGSQGIPEYARLIKLLQDHEIKVGIIGLEQTEEDIQKALQKLGVAVGKNLKDPMQEFIDQLNSIKYSSQIQLEMLEEKPDPLRPDNFGGEKHKLPFFNRSRW